MPEKIEELVRAALAAAQEAGDLSAFELDDCAIERRLILLMASGPPPWP